MPTYKEIITDAKDRMSKTREAFKREMQSMRAGRANPQILDRITVDYYGVQTPLNQMGNISAPEPRMLVISLWDAKAIPAVEKAIQVVRDNAVVTEADEAEDAKAEDAKDAE